MTKIPTKRILFLASILGWLILSSIPVAAQKTWHFESPSPFMERRVYGMDGSSTVERQTSLATPTSIDFNNQLYLAWVGTDANNSINLRYMGDLRGTDLSTQDNGFPNKVLPVGTSSRVSLILVANRLFIAYVPNTAKTTISFIEILSTDLKLGKTMSYNLGSQVGGEDIMISAAGSGQSIYASVYGTRSKKIYMTNFGVSISSIDNSISIGLQNFTTTPESAIAPPSIEIYYFTAPASPFSPYPYDYPAAFFAWTGTDNHLNGRFYYSDPADGTNILSPKKTWINASSDGGPTLFRKPGENTITMQWRGYKGDQALWEGTFLPTLDARTENFEQFRVTDGVNNAYSNLPPTIIPIGRGQYAMCWIGTDHQQFWLSHGLCYNYSSWTGDLLSPYLKLKDIIIPGSRGAGSFGNIGCGGLVGPCYSQMQSQSFKEQMYAGYRYFDIRVLLNTDPVYGDNRLHCLNGSIPDNDAIPISAETICGGADIENGILNEAVAFLQNNPGEFVILNMEQFWGVTGSNFHASAQSRLLELLKKSKYQPYLLRKNGTEAHQIVTLNQLSETPLSTLKGKIILTTPQFPGRSDDIQLAQEEIFFADEFELSTENNFRYFVQTSDIDKLKEGQELFIRNSTDLYKRIDWQLSFNHNDYIKCQAEDATPCLDYSLSKGFSHLFKSQVRCNGSNAVRLGILALSEEEPSIIDDLNDGLLDGESRLGLANIANQNLLAWIQSNINQQRAVFKPNIIYTDGSTGVITDWIVNANYRIAPGEFQVSAHHNVLSTTISMPAMSCNQLVTDSVRALVQGGHPPYKFRWLPGGDTQNYTRWLLPGLHQLRVTDAWGYKTEKEFLIEKHSGAFQMAMGEAKKQAFQFPVGHHHYASHCDSLIATVESKGLLRPVAGKITAQLWFEKDANQTEYVSRYYNLMPELYPGTSTGSVTLYYTQSEFDKYNEANPYNLPAGPSDDNNIRNLIIVRYEGQSGDLSGSSQSYHGTREEIYVQPQDVIWNSENQRWEVSFVTKGWGGFFLEAHNGVLNHNWIQVKADWLGENPRISWEVQEKAQRNYLPEYSLNGTDFYSSLQRIPALSSGHNTYTSIDTARTAFFAKGKRPVLFYRVRATNQSGTIRYSPVVSLAPDLNTLYIYPNPVHDQLTVTATEPAQIRISDISGRTVWEGRLEIGQNGINASSWLSGMYILKNMSNGANYKIIHL